MNDTRLKEIDILKAFAIIFMISGHAEAPYAKVTGMFHMAVFIMASGFFYKDECSENISNLLKHIKKKIKQLWKPFFVWNTVFVLLHNFFCEISFYTKNNEIFNYTDDLDFNLIGPYSFDEIIKNIIKGALFGRSEQFTSVLWFVKVLFFISCLFATVDYLIKNFLPRSNKIKVHTFISVLFLFIGYYLSLAQKNIGGIGQINSFYILYYVGTLLPGLTKKTKKFSNAAWILLICISYIIVIICSKIGSISFAKNRYENPFFLLTTSFAGWIMLYGISFLISKQKISKPLCVVGQSTFEILVLHLPCFKIVTLIKIIIYKYPQVALASYPILRGNGGFWWLAYTIIGVCTPVVYRIAKFHFSNTVKQKMNFQKYLK